VVDCGGGTVDITVHEMDSKTGKLNELHKATGGPHGSAGTSISNEHRLHIYRIVPYILRIADHLRCECVVMVSVRVHCI